MGKIAVIAVIAALGMPSAALADWAPGARTSPTPATQWRAISQPLSIAYAKQAILAFYAADQPTADRISHCRQDSRATVTCTNTEFGVLTYWTGFDGQRIVMTVTSRARVHLRPGGSVRIGVTVLWFAG